MVIEKGVALEDPKSQNQHILSSSSLILLFNSFVWNILSPFQWPVVIPYFLKFLFHLHSIDSKFNLIVSSFSTELISLLLEFHISNQPVYH